MKTWCYDLIHFRTSSSMRQLLLLLLAVGLAAGQEQCYAQNSNPYVYFTTATTYESVHGRDTTPVVIPQCKPVQFWIMSRHGTRYTDDVTTDSMWELPDLRDQIISNHEKENSGKLCDDDLENLKKWTPQTVHSVDEDLHQQGYNDLYFMAQRFQSRFPTLLNQSYSPDKFEVKFTNKQRTAVSAFAFLEGLFGSTATVQYPQPVKGDPVIRPYKSCKKWIKKVDENEDTFKEMNKFQDGSYVKSVIKAVSERLGFDDKLSIDEINAMYAACRYEKAWHVSQISPWCAVFSEDDLKILEYRDDLLYYYNTGYGIEMNGQVGCPPVKDFLDRFSQIEKGKQQPDGVLYFSHASMLQLLLTPLGLAKDSQDLTHSNYEQMKNRKWRMSLITPFATNLAVVLFNCNAGDPFRVQFYLSENLLELEGCNKGLCDWSFIKNKYSSIQTDCNLDFC